MSDCPRCGGSKWKSWTDKRNSIETRTCEDCGFQKSNRVQMTITQGAEMERRRMDSMFSGMKHQKGRAKFWGNW